MQGAWTLGRKRQRKLLRAAPLGGLFGTKLGQSWVTAARESTSEPSVPVLQVAQAVVQAPGLSSGGHNHVLQSKHV